ncbi:MAG: CxxxxCH/CxxCH domain-containing protein [Polyangiales bacterium]
MKRALVVPLLALGCAEPAEGTARAPRDRPEVRAVLTARCVRCHDGASAAGGWRADTFAGALGCGGAAVLPDGGVDAPLLRALDRADHRDLLTPAERATVTAWVRAGAPPGLAGVHPEGIGDPRAATFHARALRDERWSRMLDAGAPESCGRCHEGAPTRPAGVTRGTPGATPCTTCHTQPQGALACTTCHRVEGAPGATGCVAPQGDPTRGAHAAHLSPRLRAQGLACGACHPPRRADLAAGSTATASCRWPSTARSRATTRATTAPAGRAPSPVTPAAAPTRRPRGAAARPRGVGAATARPRRIIRPALRDLSRRGQRRRHRLARQHVAPQRPGRPRARRRTCGDCHGRGADPWPETGAHALHRDAPRSHPVDCAHCHVVPAQVRAPGHLDGVVQVTLTGDALRRGARATFDRGTCAEVACHGAGLRAPATALRWRPTDASSDCTVCHGAPPPAPHPAASTCASLLCHGGSVSETPAGLRITASGRATHIDGVVQFGRAP